MAKGMNMGIFFLLGVIGSVLAGVAGFFVYLAKRSASTLAGTQLHSRSAPAQPRLLQPAANRSRLCASPNPTPASGWRPSARFNLWRNS